MSKTRRRQYGSGSLYQRASDGRWIGELQVGWHPTTGRKRVVTVSAKTEAACKARLDAKRKEIDRSGAPALRADQVTVKAYADEWLERRKRKARPSSYSADRSAIRTWIVPVLGRKRLTSLTPADVRAVADAQRRAGNASSSILRTHVTLTRLLRAAMLDNPQVSPSLLLVERPEINATDRDGMAVDDAMAVLEAAMLLPHVSRWVAALLQGIRPAEALGLTWEALDRRAGVMDISWQLQRLPYNVPRDRSSGFRVPDNFEARHLVDAYHLTRPKTKKGQRIIPVVPWMARALDQWREVAPPSPYGLVWPAADGSPARADHDDEEWKAIQATAGVAHPAGRFYVRQELRHTTVSLLVELGVDRAVIEQIVGHAKLVDAYVHAPDHMAREALEKVARRLQLEG